MIISVNTKPQLDDFKELMLKTDKLLNEDAIKRPDYYKTRGGNPLEDDVKNALDECAKGTAFENTIEKISGHKFPDIIAAKLYGVEVKSTKDDHWTSTGSSILENTRINGIERIFMTFGKLGGNPIEFLSKPYEECLSGIAVTHMPRYLINMKMNAGETIFDKMGIAYDDLRSLDNPIAPVSKYYRSLLKPGESLWWTGDSDESVSATVRLWKNVLQDEKRRCVAYACVNFPEIFKSDYDNYSLWLASQGIVDAHIRDQFSSRGRITMSLPDGTCASFPGVYRRIRDNVKAIISGVATQGDIVPVEEPPIVGKELKVKLLSWIDIVSKLSGVGYDTSMDALSMLFFNMSYENVVKSLTI